MSGENNSECYRVSVRLPIDQVDDFLLALEEGAFEALGVVDYRVAEDEMLLASSEADADDAEVPQFAGAPDLDGSRQKLPDQHAATESRSSSESLLSDSVLKSLPEISDLQRTMLMLWLQHLSPAEIAAQVHRSERTVRKFLATVRVPV